MGYKIVGVCLLIFAGIYCAVYFCRRERKRVRAIDGYISLLFYIKGQIDCFAKPIADILRGADKQIIADCIGASRSETIQGEFEEIPVLIDESAGLLEDESVRILRSFSGELGSTFRDEQLKRCDYYIAALTRERERLFEALPAREKVCSALSVSCALVFAVLLW